MLHSKKFPAATVMIFLVMIIAGQLTRADETAGIEYFETHIRPLFAEHCYKCHSADAKKLKANLYLDSRAGWQSGGDSGPAIVPGKTEKSLLIHAVSHTDDDLKMPPETRLPDSAIEKFTTWVAMGAPDPREGEVKERLPKIDLEKGREFWSFKPPVDHPVPMVKDPSWPTSEMDRFILARLESENLTPSGDASKHTLLRRVFYDLIGLPPSPEEMKSFLDDSSPAPNSASAGAAIGSMSPASPSLAVAAAPSSFPMPGASAITSSTPSIRINPTTNLSANTSPATSFRTHPSSKETPNLSAPDTLSSEPSTTNCRITNCSKWNLSMSKSTPSAGPSSA